MDRIDVPNLSVYQEMAVATMNPAFDSKGRLGNSALGLCDEAFEVADHLFDEEYNLIGTRMHDSEFKLNLLDELGDVMWYAAVCADSMGEQLSRIWTGRFDLADCSLNHSVCDGLLRKSWFQMCANAAFIGGRLKKHIYQEHPMDDQMRREICNALQHVVERVRIMCGVSLSTLQECCTMNITKLRKRYPTGKFSADDSINRTV